MGCDALLKGTSVDGVYTADPKKDPTATRYETLTYQDVLAKDLRVMDASAIAMMRDTGIPIVVFSIREDNSLRRTLTGEVLTFATAVDPDSAFSFGVLGDTQKNPPVTGQVARRIWERRPNFVIHLGDVVDRNRQRITEGVSADEYDAALDVLQRMARNLGWDG